MDIAARIIRADAYIAAEAPTTLVHYTAQELLRTIIGPGEFSRGLVPGGLASQANKGHRPDVYLSTSMPLPDGTLPDRFLKPDTTVSIRLDGPNLKEDKFNRRSLRCRLVPPRPSLPTTYSS